MDEQAIQRPFRPLSVDSRPEPLNQIAGAFLTQLICENRVLRHKDP
jgi:hypothetical protein